MNELYELFSPAGLASQVLSGEKSPPKTTCLCGTRLKGIVRSPNPSTAIHKCVKISYCKYVYISP